MGIIYVIFAILAVTAVFFIFYLIILGIGAALCVGIFAAWVIALIAIGKRLIRLVKGHFTWDDAVAIVFALAVLSLPATSFLMRYISLPTAEAVRAYLLGLSKGSLEAIVAGYLILAMLIPAYLDVEKVEKGSALSKFLKALGKPLVNLFGILCVIYLVLVVPAVLIFYPPGPFQVYVMAGVVGLAILPVVITFFVAPSITSSALSRHTSSIASRGRGQGPRRSQGSSKTLEAASGSPTLLTGLKA